MAPAQAHCDPPPNVTVTQASPPVVEKLTNFDPIAPITSSTVHKLTMAHLTIEDQASLDQARTAETSNNLQVHQRPQKSTKSGNGAALSTFDEECIVTGFRKVSGGRVLKAHTNNSARLLTQGHSTNHPIGRPHGRVPNHHSSMSNSAKNAMKMSMRTSKMGEYINAIDTQLQHKYSGPDPVTAKDPHTSNSLLLDGVEPSGSLRASRKALVKRVIRDSITTYISAGMRASLAEEIKVLLSRQLNDQEKDSLQTYSAFRKLGLRYWAVVYEEYRLYDNDARTKAFTENQPWSDIYAHQDEIRAIYFWAQHQEKISYGQICYELSLPLGLLEFWITRFLKY